MRLSWTSIKLSVEALSISCLTNATSIQASGKSEAGRTTDQRCDRNVFSAGNWHHVQIKMCRVTSPNQIIFEQVALDGVVQNLTCGGNPCTRLAKMLFARPSIFN